MSKTTRYLGLTGAILFLLSAAAPVRAGINVSVHHMGHHVYEVDGSFEVASSSHVVWAVLTDFENIGRFVREVISSKVVERNDGRLLLEQSAVGRAFLVSKKVHVLLDVRQEEGRRIEFEDILLNDFDQYRGTWELRQEEGATLVRYRLTAKPGQGLPTFVAQRALQKNARRLLEQVRAEMLRRSGGPLQAEALQARE
ncbi:MAG: SRPBCC family protein [Elusimicrobia bacterium]|nr:SRPBCC family protein [Elusimicrobiota bacterium]